MPWSWKGYVQQQNIVDDCRVVILVKIIKIYMIVYQMNYAQKTQVVTQSYVKMSKIVKGSHFIWKIL